MVVVLGVLVIGGLGWLLLRNRGGGTGRARASGDGLVSASAESYPDAMAGEYGCAPVPQDMRPLGRIEVSGLGKAYNGVTAVQNVSFTAEPGRVTGLLGPNGAGKTTTLRMLLGLVTPSCGVARIGQSRYAEIDRPSLAVGAVLEASAAHEGRTGRDHLRVLCQSAGLPLVRADEVLADVGLTQAANRKVRGYSLGMRQRLGVAAALLGDPRVLILDEPCNGLDPAGIRWIREFLRLLAASGRTVLVSSHQLAEMEQLADDLVVIAAGRVVASGSLQAVVGAHAGLEEAFLELTDGAGGIR
jgi:ABC-2 type transport system ATP-binding protein